MSPSVVSLLALFVAILLSIISRMNVGVLALVFAHGIGVLLMGLKMRDIAAGFPVSILITLLGLSLLFGQARANGTLDRMAGWAVQLARGNIGMIPPMFFLLAVCLGTLGAGNIGAVALLAPIGMAVAGDLGIPAFLMALMVANGGSAAAFSPVAPTGVVANALMARIGLTHVAWQNYRNCLLAHALIGLSGYFLLGGVALIRKGRSAEAQDRLERLLQARREAWGWRQWLTLGVILGLLGIVAVFKVDVGVAALCGAVVLTLCRAADEEQAFRTIPFGTIIMVCGMMVLMAILERSGGIDLFTGLLLRVATRRSITFIMGLCTGVISAYSSSAGVVLPAFLPTVPGLIRRLGGGDAMAIASSVNVGAHLVDVSPLSTLGALCLAHAAVHEDRTTLYHQLLAWGLSMALVGALFCYLFFGVLGLAG